jgi:breast cancer 2 susceptibility protein
MASKRRWCVPSTIFLALLRLIAWRTDDMPERIESMFDDCEYSSDPSSVLRRASKNEAGWLARFARKRGEEEREALELGLERELQVIKYQRLLCRSSLTQRSSQSACPPREVRSFRVLLMRDACATRRPARRVVELTAWDVLTLSFDEASAGQFKEGHRFQVRV